MSLEPRILAQLGRRLDIRSVPVGPGYPLRLVAMFGGAPSLPSVDRQLLCIEAACSAGADAVQEVSTAGQPDLARTELLAAAPVPYGTVLAYEVVLRVRRSGETPTAKQLKKLVLQVLDAQISQGVDFITIHAALSRELLRETAQTRHRRIISMPSRATAMLLDIMDRAGCDNPLHTSFEELVQQCAKSNTVISLGSSMRSAALADALDHPQRAELVSQGRLCEAASELGAQVMVEGLSHAPPQMLVEYAHVVRSTCPDAAVTALGPLPTDIAVGTDDVAGAIGVLFAARAGFDLVNVVTATEHIGLPSPEDTAAAVRAAKVGLHVARVMEDGRSCVPDRAMSEARAALSWSRQPAHALIGSALATKLRHVSAADGKPCNICDIECPLTRQTGPVEIPAYLRPVWCRAMAEFDSEMHRRGNDWCSVFTFGSLVTGDFVTRVVAGEPVPFSDLEFTVVSEKPPSAADIRDLDRRLHSIEDTAPYRAGSPLFHIDARITSRRDFLSKRRDTFFWHHLAVNGRTVRGQHLVEGIADEWRPPVSTIDLRSKIPSLLLEALLLVPKEWHQGGCASRLDCMKLTHALATCGSKMALMVASSRTGEAPSTLSSAISILEESKPKLAKSASDCLLVRTKGAKHPEAALAPFVEVLSGTLEALFDAPAAARLSEKADWLSGPCSLDHSSKHRLEALRSCLGLVDELPEAIARSTVSGRWWRQRCSLFEKCLIGMRANAPFFSRHYPHAEAGDGTVDAQEQRIR